jgi:hypothetical protein
MLGPRAEVGHVTAVEGILRVEENPALEGLLGMEALNYVSGDLEITGNATLSSLDGLAVLHWVGWDMSVSLNPELPQCEACELLDQVTWFEGGFEAYGNLADACTDNCI